MSQTKIVSRARVGVEKRVDSLVNSAFIFPDVDNLGGVSILEESEEPVFDKRPEFEITSKASGVNLQGCLFILAM
jgi:hypothetical protein